MGDPYVAVDDPELSSTALRADAGINRLRSVGVSEAPRGTLFHDYTVDRDGVIRKVNLLVATGQNNPAMNRIVAQIARHYITGPDIPEALLNRVEHGLRCYDPRRWPDAPAHPTYCRGWEGVEGSDARVSQLVEPL